MTIGDGSAGESGAPQSFNWGLGAGAPDTAVPDPVVPDPVVPVQMVPSSVGPSRVVPDPVAPNPAVPNSPVLPDADMAASPFVFPLAIDGSSSSEPSSAGTPVLTTRPRREKPKNTPLGWAGLVFAVLVPPLGLILSIVARTISLGKYRRTTRVLDAALTVSIVFIVIFAVGGFVGYAFVQANADNASIVAESKPFCDALKTTPGVLGEVAYGWPTTVKALPDTLVDMKAYEARWKKLASIAPSGISSEVAAVARAATTIVDDVESTKTIDRQANLDSMNSVTSSTTAIPDWVAKYCTK